MELESSSAAVLRASKRLRFSPCNKKFCCVVLQCWHPDGDEYKFYIVDLDLDLDSCGGGGGDVDSYTHKEPNIRFKGSVPPVAFCALNSTLYMFEGDTVDGFGQRTSAGKFHISPHDFNFKLEKHNLDSIHNMHHSKISPKAIPTPDGNHILVFSSQAIPVDGGLVFGNVFELYNVANDSWQDLPPMLPTRGGSSFIVEAYGFLTNSVFAIQIEAGFYGLDLTTPAMFWEEWGGSIPVHGHFIGIHGFYVTPFWARANRGEFQVPVSKFPDDSEFPDDSDYVPGPKCFPNITLLGHNEDGLIDIGIVQAQFHPDHPDAKNLRVILDIYQTDTEQFKRVKEQCKFREKPGRVTKTFKLMLDYDLSAYFSGHMYLFSV